MSPASGFGVNFDSVNRLRALAAEMPSRLVWMMRRSLNDRPDDSLRTFCSAWLSGASRASMIRLRTPSCSMNDMTSCCAPAPIDSMATTAATPKIIPSIVSIERSLCARRFSRPRRSSGRTSADQRCVRALICFPGVPPRERPLLGPSPAASPARSNHVTRSHGSLASVLLRRPRTRERAARRLGARRRDVGIDEGDDVPLVQAVDDGAALGRGDDLDGVAFEVIAVLQEDVIAARLLEDGLTRNVQGVWKLASVDRHAQR